ncbi:MAG: c-type cytochrome [Verrucomicrobiota bacterium]
MRLRFVCLCPIHLVAAVFCWVSLNSPPVPARAEDVRPDDRTTVAIEALKRLKDVDLESNPALKGAVLKVLDQVRGTPQFVEIVREFQWKGQEPALLEYALNNPNESSGVEAMRLVLAGGNLDPLKAALAGTNTLSALKVLGHASDNAVVPLIAPLLEDTRRDLPTRKEAARALAKSRDGAKKLLNLAREERLPAELKFIASTELNAAPWPEIKAEAAQVLPLPTVQNAEPLPPVSELVKRSGDSNRGAALFRSPQIGCINCHQVNGEGIDFGPNLSEIGTKLGKDALYESILDPNAGISFGYEGWQIELKNGDEVFGLIVSETAEEMAVKAQTGIVTRHKKSEVTRREQSKISVMPAGLQATMSTQGLVDLVEYLSSLKKK